jgi:predicted ATP-binding protein involved in virulence
MQSAQIKHLVVEGLHDQYDINLTLKQGLNIIYGKNGRGKTTALHILANVLEMDFKRFQYLNFRKISLETFSDNKIEILREGSEGEITIWLNESQTSYKSGHGELASEAEYELIRTVIGERPTYLPAFRSVLERVRSEAGAYYRDSSKESDLDEIESREYQALREIHRKSALPNNREMIGLRALREESSITARKTLQCRQWFGEFVPVVRYPSIQEVIDGLTSEWRTAELDTARKEQSMFADGFVNVFRTIVGLDNPINTDSAEDLIGKIEQSLEGTDYQIGNRESLQIYRKLLEATNHLKNDTNRKNKSTENAVLNLYLQTLKKRTEERTQAFQKSRDFESSINKFLDKKSLKIGFYDTETRSRLAVTVGTEGGRQYGLSSLSSGEKQILTMLYSASRSRFTSGVFLIDEPELSLHIDWQRQILRELMRQSSDRQIVACTHSPEVGGDHIEDTQDFEPTITKAPQPDLFASDDGSE